VRRILLALVFGFWSTFALAQALVPNAMTQFTDSNGVPLAGGAVYMYVPGTTTAKTTWKDPGETVPNTQPIVLDSAGRALIWGSGEYRQVVLDVNGNTIWDQLTCAAGGIC
jgi:hypothetical protein